MGYEEYIGSGIRQAIMISQRAIEGLGRLRSAIVDIEFFKESSLRGAAVRILRFQEHRIWDRDGVSPNQDPTGMKSSVPHRVLLSQNAGSDHLMLAPCRPAGSSKRTAIGTYQQIRRHSGKPEARAWR